jgi:Xaa-Pro aminopeptidase
MKSTYPWFYDKTEIESCKKRRTQLLQSTGKALVIAPAGPAHHLVPYRAASDFYYLTGLDVAGSILVLDPRSKEQTSILFMPELSDRERQWDGPRPDFPEAKDAYGLDSALPLKRFPDFLEGALASYTEIYWVPGVDPLVDHQVIQQWSKRSAPIAVKNGVPACLHDLRPVLAPQRLIKDAVELERLRKAAEIGAAGHVAAMKATKPGMDERQIQALIEKAFFDLGADAPSFPTIAAGGTNATVLHYIANNQRLPEDGLLLVDAGARWNRYCSDITRTFPVNGKFSTAQKDLYNVVWKAQQAVFAIAKPGKSFELLQKTAIKTLSEGLIDLKIVKGSLDEVIETELYKPFYMHGIGHSVGLDVHDPTPSKVDGRRLAKLEENIVMTVEPGLYIPRSTTKGPKAFRGLGVRIEDDILITSKGCEVISGGDNECDRIEGFVHC